MINNLARKLKIINKDTFESAWLKCILDEVPKEKHLQVRNSLIEDDSQVRERRIK